MAKVQVQSPTFTADEIQNEAQRQAREYPFTVCLTADPSRFWGIYDSQAIAQKIVSRDATNGRPGETYVRRIHAAELLGSAEAALKSRAWWAQVRAKEEARAERKARTSTLAGVA